MVTDVGHAQRVIRPTRDAESTGGGFTEIGLVTWRSLVKLTRTPVLLFFSLFMPLIWLVMFSQTFGTVFSSATSGGFFPSPPPPPYIPPPPCGRLRRRVLGSLEHGRTEDEEHRVDDDGEFLPHVPAPVPEHGNAPEGALAFLGPDLLHGQPGQLYGRRRACAHPNGFRLDGR